MPDAAEKRQRLSRSRGTTSASLLRIRMVTGTGQGAQLGIGCRQEMSPTFQERLNFSGGRQEMHGRQSPIETGCQTLLPHAGQAVRPESEVATSLKGLARRIVIREHASDGVIPGHIRRQPQAFPRMGHGISGPMLKIKAKPGHGMRCRVMRILPQ